MKHTILCVDDEINNVDALERIFRRKYKVLKATSAKEALKLVKTEPVSLIISDQRMPQKTGVEFLKESIEFCPEAIRILLTGYTDIESVIDAINSGEVYRYITKPWDPVDLQNAVEKGLEKFDLSHELKEKNIKLEEAYEELKTLDEAKNQFMILINHELKTPLTSLLSFLELLKETSLDEDQTKYVERVSKSSHRLKKIIDDALLFISAETGIKKTSVKKIQTQKWLTDLEKSFHEPLLNKGQTLNWSSKVDHFKSDPEILNEVMGRLLENANRFGPKNSVIEVRVEEVANDQEEGPKTSHGGIKITVMNEGKSIPKKIIDKILKPFTLDEDIMKHSEGLGLGLSLSQALLKLLGSQLKIESTKSKVEVSFKLT